MRHGKVIFLIESLRGGGAEHMTARLTGAFANTRQVEIVTWYPDCAFSLPSAITVTVLRERGAVRQIAALRRHFAAARPDTVISVLSPAILRMLFVKLLSPRLSCRWLINLHSVWSKEQAGLSPIRRAMRSLLLKLSAQLADTVILVSREAAADMEINVRVPAKKIAVIENGIDKALIIAKSAEVPSSQTAPNQAPIIMAAGRLTPEKNHLLLLSAFALTRKKQNCRLLIMGNGPMREALRLRAKDMGVANEVTILPFQENPWQYMARAAVFVLPSEFEGCPLVLAEAMLCKVPVVTTNWGAGLAEMTGGKNICLTVPRNDPQTMSEAITTLLKNSALADTLKLAAFEHAQANFRDFSDTLNAYSSLINSAEKQNDE